MGSLTVAPPTFHAFRPQYSWGSAETTNQELMSESHRLRHENLPGM